MTDSTPPGAGDPGGDALDYLRSNQAEFTREALTAELKKAGHSDQEIAAAWAAVGTEARTPPDLARARMITFVLYGAIYAFFVLSLLQEQGGYGTYQIAAIVLTVVMGVAFGISLRWLRRRRSGAAVTTLTTLLMVPVALLVVVAGLCTATTGAPFLFFNAS
jgi:hypothetical protein